MEPFTIECGKCRSKIRVKNPKMVGQVAKCPKCAAELTIQPPTQIRVENAGGGHVDSMAMTKEGIDPALAGGSLLDGDLTNVDFGGVESEEYRLAPPDIDASSESLSQAVKFTPDDESGEDAVGAPSQTWQPETPLLPSDDWASKESVKSKQMLLIGSLAVAGLVLCVIGFLAFMNWYGESAQTPELAGGPNVDPASASDAPGGSEGPTNVPDPDGVADADSNTANELDSDAAIEPGANDPDANIANDVGTESATAIETDAGSESGTAAAEDLESGTAGNVASDGSEEGGFNADDPFGDGTEEPAMTPVEKAQQALPNPRLAQFSPMLAWQVAPTIPENGVPLGPPPITAEDLGISSVAALEPIAALDWSEVSKTTVPAFIMGGDRRTAQAITLWTTMSRVPTMVDLDSLAAANFDPNKPVKIEPQKDKSLSALVRELAFQTGLDANPQENRMVRFSGQAKAIAENLPDRISIKEWDTAGQKWLVEMLAQMLEIEPEAWQIDGETLSRDPSRLNDVDWFRALRLIDRLRQRLGAEPALSAYSKASLSMPFLQASQVSKLKKPVSSVALQASPLGQKIAELCAQQGIHVWFDWPALGQAGVGPATTGLVVTYGRSLSQVLQAYAKQFPMEIAIVDSNTILITSEKGYRKTPRVFVLPTQGRTVEQWKQDLEQLSLLNADGVGDLRVIATPDSKHLVVRCCFPRLEY
ncbi:MAG: hypothetical protein AAGG44_00530 [Planctomycetota bacterium]